MALSVGDAILNVGFDPAQLERGLKNLLGSQEGNFANAGQKLSKSLTGGLGDGLTGFQKFGAGVAATGLVVAGVSLKMALDFESSLTSIKALTNSSTQDIAQYRTAILSLSGQVAQSPKQLAEALYFVSSAGFTGKEAIDVLTISAKAAAAGLSETKVVADAVTSAMNAYGHANLTAKQASDVLVATVNEGKAEFADIAGAIGQVVGVASAAGVSFNEVGAAMAAMTSIGISADESATVLKSTLVALEAPSSKVKNLLGELGLSADDLRTSIREKGLIATVQDLGNRLHGQVGPILELIPNHRTLALVLGATGQQAQQYTDILGRLNHASDGQGATAKAFAERQKDVKFQLEQAKAAAEAFAVNIGEHLIPVLRGTLEVGRSVTGFFADNKTAAYALAVIVGGPLVGAMVAWTVAEARVIGGKILSFWTSVADVAVGLVARLLGLNTALETIGTTEGVVATETVAVSGGFAAVGTAALGTLGPLGLALGAIQLFGHAFDEASKSVAQLSQDVNAKQLVDDFNQIGDAAEKSLGGTFSVKRWVPFADSLGLTKNKADELRAAFRKIADESPGTAQRIIDGLKAQGQATGDYEKILAGVSKGHQQAAKDAQAGAQVTGDAAKKAGAAETGAISDATKEQEKHQAAIDGVVASLRGIGGAGADGLATTIAGTKANDEELKKLATSLDKIQDAYRGLPTTAGEALAALGVEGKLTADQLASIATEAKKVRDGIASSFGSATSLVGNFASQLGADPAKAQLDARAATLSHTDALQTQADAIKKLNDLRSGRVKEADQASAIAKAENAVARAQIEVERTSDAAAKSQDSLGISIGSINKFLTDQVKAARDWSTNLQALVKAGVDHGLIAELAQAGPKAAPLVKGLLDDVKAGNLGVINKSQDDLHAILTETQGTILGYETPFYIAGQTAGTGAKDGIGAGIAGAGAAMASALDTAIAQSNVNAIMKARGLDAGTYFVIGLQGALFGYTPEVLKKYGGKLPGVPGSGIAGPPAPLEPGRAAGGPVWPGHDFLVGEHGPEIARFDANAHIYPSGTLPPPRGGDGGSMGQTVKNERNFTVTGNTIVAQDPEQLYSDLEHRARLKALSGE